MISTHRLHKLARRNWRWCKDACESAGIDPLSAFRSMHREPTNPRYHFYKGAICGMAEALEIDGEELLRDAGVAGFEGETEITP
jgi:hypothetical protein